MRAPGQVTFIPILRAGPGSWAWELAWGFHCLGDPGLTPASGRGLRAQCLTEAQEGGALPVAGPR